MKRSYEKTLVLKSFFPWIPDFPRIPIFPWIPDFREFQLALRQGSLRCCSPENMYVCNAGFVLPAFKNCQVCKIKIKEVHNLKKNMIELEEEISELRSDLKIVSERNTDVEDRLTRELNLRKRVEKDLIQLQEELSESDGSSSDDSSNDGYCSDNEIQSKTKGKSSKYGQGGGSKKNTASKKTHRNQSNVSSDDECVSEVERKSNPNKNSSSGKHQKEELRQGNTVTLRETQRNHPEAEKDSKKKDPVVKTKQSKHYKKVGLEYFNLP